MATSPAPELRRPHDRRAADELTARYRARVLAAFPGRIERILLFGSRGRGEAHPESDWDFAVFLDQEPTPDDRKRISEIGREIRDACGDLIQSHLFAGQKWLATDELACNIRDEGLVVYGPDHVPMVERPVLEHAAAALAKAERYAELVAETADERFEGVIHGAYYAMFHAARAALLAAEGSASTHHGSVVTTFARVVRRRRLGKVAGELAKTLAAAYELRVEADYGSKDLTEAGRRLREQVAPFLDLCRSLVEQCSGSG